MWLSIHLAHIAAFLGCLFASGSKLRILLQSELDHGCLARLRKLDKVSSASTGVIMLTGVAMLAAQPGKAAHLGEGIFQLKLAAFILASSLVLATKVYLRRAPASDLNDGQAIPTPVWMRGALAVDLAAILIIAFIGAGLAHGLI